MSYWCDLPWELVKKIEENFVLYVDKVNFRCVCVSWQLALPNLPNLRQPQLPWLLLPYSAQTSGSRCGFFNPLDNKVYELDVPQLGEKVFKGTYDGWVVIAQENASIYIVNPLSRARVQLPPRTEFPDVIEYHVDRRGNEFLLKQLTNDYKIILDSAHVRNYMLEKIVLSSSPTSTEFVAVAAYGVVRKLAYCKYGDNKWYPLVSPEDSECGYEDVLFYDGKLYALTYAGQLMVCDSFDSSPHMRILVRKHPKRMYESYYLVHSHVGLMMINRCQTSWHVKTDSDDKYLFRTYGFNNIYKFDICTSSWVQMKNISDDILFMDLGAQLSVSSRGFPGHKGNTIYFAGVNLNFNCEGIEGCFDDGLFNLDSEVIESLGYKCDSHSIWPSPIWVMPNPY